MQDDRGGKRGVLDHGVDQEPAVGRDVIERGTSRPADGGARYEQPFRRGGFALGSSPEGDGHEGAVVRAVEDLAAVTAPNRIISALGRDQPFAAGSRKTRDVDR